MLQVQERKANQEIAQSKQAPKSPVRVLASVAKTLLLSTATLIASAAAVEFIFACAHVGEDTIVQPDPLLGYSQIANQWVTFRSEGYSRSQINAIGFRDKMYASPKPPGVKRICITGDSMTQGLEVPDYATYSKVLERRLQAEGKPVEVINCGLSGTGTGQQYLGWRRSMAALKPDMLIVGYHLGDTDDNVGGCTNPPRPTFLLNKAGNLSVDFKDVDKWFASENSRFYSSFGELRKRSRILAVLSKADLDLQSDPAYKMLKGLLGRPMDAAWSFILRSLPEGNWHIPETRMLVKDLLAGEVSSTQLPEQTAASSSANTEKAKTRTSSNASSSSRLQSPTETKTSAPLAETSSKPNPEGKAESPAAAPQDLNSNDHGQQDVFMLKGMLWLHKERMAVTKEILRRLNRECLAQNCKLVVVGLPAYSNTIIYYRELIDLEKLAQEENFQYLDGWKEFPARTPLEDSKYHFTTHFNRAGHKLLADSLYRQLFSKADFWQ